MQAEGHPIGMKRDTKEGLSTWVCGYSMLAGGEGDEQKAYDYINAFLADGTADYLVNSWGYGHSNQAAMDKIDPEVLAGMGYDNVRSEEHTSELQSLMRISYAVFCLKKKKNSMQYSTPLVKHSMINK